MSFPTADVWMQVDKMDSIATTTVEVSNEIDAIPDLDGYGNLHSLRQAMARNDYDWRKIA